MKRYVLAGDAGTIDLNLTSVVAVEVCPEGSRITLEPLGMVRVQQPYPKVLADVAAALRALDDLS